MNESLALTELISYLEKEGHSFFLFLEDEERNLEDKIRTIEPDVFLIPADIGGHHWAHRIAAWLKARFDKTVIAGGTYPTFYSEVLLKDNNFDFLIVGEAELPLKTLLERLETRIEPDGIQGIWFNKDNRVHRTGYSRAIVDLDSLPLPRRDIYYKYPFIRDFKLKRFATGRGCFNKCSYCFNPKLAAGYPPEIPYVRRKSVDKVIDEIAHVSSMAPIKSIHFSDDIFITSKKWLLEFAQKYPQKVGIKYSCNLMLENLDISIIDALAESGCRAVAIGIESGSEDIRRLLGRSFTNQEAIKMAHYLRKKGIMVTSFNMLALPGESIDDGLETLRLNNLMKVGNARVNLTIPLPGTQLAGFYGEQGGGEFFEEILNVPDFSQGKHLKQMASSEPDFRNLMLVFPFAAQHPWSFQIVEKISRKRYNSLLGILGLFAIWREKKFFQIDLFSGFRYFLHTGSPYKRSKNFATLI